MQPSSRHSLGSSRRYSWKDRRPSQIRKVADKDGWAMHRHYRAEMSCPGYSRRSQTCTTCSQKHVERKTITLLWYVRFGKANKTSCRRDVRFTPESGHLQCTTACPLWANSGHWVSAPRDASVPCPADPFVRLGFRRCTRRSPCLHAQK